MLLDVVVGIHCLLETLVNLLERVEAVGVLLEALTGSAISFLFL